MIATSKLSQALDAEVVAALADDDRDGSPDDGLLEAALAAAEESVRKSIAAAGLFPGEALPPLLEDLAVTLAVERLFERRRELLPGPWADRAARARALLARIADGTHPVAGLARTANLVLPLDEPECAPPLHRRATLREL